MATTECPMVGWGGAPPKYSKKEQRRGSASCKQLTLKKKSEMLELIELHMLDPLPQSLMQKREVGVARGREFLLVALSS